MPAVDRRRCRSGPRARHALLGLDEFLTVEDPPLAFAYGLVLQVMLEQDLRVSDLGGVVGCDLQRVEGQARVGVRPDPCPCPGLERLAGAGVRRLLASNWYQTVSSVSLTS